MINTALQLISVWKKVPLCSLLYYLLLTAGYSITMVSIKLFITVSMMIGNIIWNNKEIHNILSINRLWRTRLYEIGKNRMECFRIFQNLHNSYFSYYNLLNYDFYHLFLYILF